MAHDPRDRDPEANLGGVWAEYRFHVLSQLERLGKDIEKTRDDSLKELGKTHEDSLREFTKIREDCLREFEKAHKGLQKVEEQVLQLRLKAAFWGGVAGAIGYLISFLADKLLRGK